MWDLICESKKEMQSADQNNGVTFAIIGSSGCGKTTMLRKVFLDRVYDKIMADKEYIITIFTESASSDALQGLDKKILIDSGGIDEDQITLYYQTNSEYKKVYNFVAVVDDCLEMKHRKTFEKMFLMYRNTNITSIVSIQYPNLIPKSIRTSVYYAICMRINNDEGVEIMINSWLSPYLPGRTLRQKLVPYREWTRDHNFFLIDNLQKKCYKVDKEYNCTEIPIIIHEDMYEGSINPPTNSRKKRKLNNLKSSSSSSSSSSFFFGNGSSAADEEESE